MSTTLPLPPMDLRLMREDDERFVASGEQLANLLYRLGLNRDGRILDVGCSVGRVALGLDGTGFHGRYFGFDVMQKQVDWAHKTLTPKNRTYQFAYVDVRNARYNPKGTVDPRTLKFPVPSATYDMACLFSIFTHFYKEDIQLYLGELYRSLRPGGRVVVTWFLYDDRNPEAAATAAYPMKYRLDDVTVYNDEEDPLRAIAFSENYVRGMIEQAGFELVGIEHGTWMGGKGPEFQDVVILRRPKRQSDIAIIARSEAKRIIAGARRRLKKRMKK